MSDIQENKHYLSRVFSEILNDSAIDNDEEHKKKFIEIKQNSWEKHSKQHTKLLKNYTNHMEENLKTKRKQKCVFFVISILILVFPVFLSCVSLYKTSSLNGQTLDKLIQALPSLITFIVPIFTVPKVIVKYLFSYKEEENMVKLIELIAKHDRVSLKEE